MPAQRPPRPVLTASILSFLLAFAGAAAASFPTTQQSKLDPNDGAANDLFGWSLALSGDTAIIGAHGDNDKGIASGSAYIYTRTNSIWDQQYKLVADDGAVEDSFGQAVAVSGDTAIVGAYGDDDMGTDSGSAYIYTRTNGIWTQQQKLVPADGAANDRFGYSVAVSGDTAIVGAPNDDEKGSAYIYTRTDGIWTYQKVVTSDLTQWADFGWSVSVSGDTAIIGATRDFIATKSGSAFVYTRTEGIWTQQQKLVPADGNSFDYFGISVSVSGDTAIIGAHLGDGNVVDSGTAYIYSRTNGIWTPQQKLAPTDGAIYDDFGWSVALSSDTAIVGAYRTDEQGDSSGSAYAFTRADGIWTQQPRILPPDGAPFDFFGRAVAFSGGTALFAAYGDDDNGVESGSIYVYTPGVPGAPILTATPGSGSGEVDLSWTTPTSGGSAILSYEVHRGVTPGALTQVATVLATDPTPNAFTDAGLTGGATYYYAVRAANDIGQGAMSNEETVVANGGDTTTPVPELGSLVLLGVGLVVVVVMMRRR